jgi:hypothetical protein
MSVPRSQDGLEAINADPADYRFTFEAHPRRVRVAFDATTVVDSSKVRVMRETRLESLCKPLGRPVLASAEFAQHFPDRFQSLGCHELRGIQGEQEILALKI